MRTKKEIIDEIAEIEDMEFRLSMIDKWDDEDYDYSNELHERKMKIKEEWQKIQGLTLADKIDISIEKIQKEISKKKLTDNTATIEKLEMAIDVLNEFKEEWK